MEKLTTVNDLNKFGCPIEDIGKQKGAKHQQFEKIYKPSIKWILHCFYISTQVTRTRNFCHEILEIDYNMSI